MHHTTRGPPAETRRHAGSIKGRNTIQIAAALLLTLGIASCVGPYNDEGYSYYGRDGEARRNATYDQPRGEYYRNDPYAAQRDATYDQRRVNTYRQDPYADRREWRDNGLWYENSFSRGRNSP